MDLEGQVKIATSSQREWKRWGRYYCRSLASAHRSGTCHNFKDQSVQHYFGSVAKDLLADADAAFSKLPPPKPSREGCGVASGAAMARAYHYRGNGCVAGDSWTCLEYNLTGRTQAMCGDACNATDEYIIELSQRTGKNISSLGGMVGHSFLAVCEWEMIRSLPKTCNSTFTNYLPTAASNNEQPSYPNVTWMQTNMYFNGSKWDMCNIHGARRVGGRRGTASRALHRFARSSPRVRAPRRPTRATRSPRALLQPFAGRARRTTAR